ncbi:MAG: NADPH-dependent FMN reductase [Myxococcota bacterium]
MRVLALSGSLREPSNTRRALAVSLDAAARAGAETGWLSLDGLPFVDGRPYDQYDGRVATFRKELLAADALLVGSPEYHGSFSGVLKNALDLVEPDELRGKLVGLVATARGDAGAMNTLNHLRQVARWVGAWVLPAQVSVPRAQEAFAPDGRVVREGLAGELEQLGAELVRYGKLLAMGTGTP